jgi:beta-aspartyl-peptidase (threonine type)
MTDNFKIVLHGGAGNLNEEYVINHGKAIQNVIQKALTEGCKILKSGGSSEDAVVAAVTILEDDPVLNAGKGAVLNEEAGFELDAALMNGQTLEVGAVIGVNRFKNPIQLSKYIMKSTKHVVFTNVGALKLLEKSGLEAVDSDYFYTKLRYEQLMQARINNQTTLDHAEKNKPDKYGTVGAVALDKKGHLAAATSTGGMTNKMVGRVGDSPMIGCGTYANDNSCAVSCTGQGEYFIRTVAAHDIAARMEYGNKSLKEATHTVLFDKIEKLGGSGGIIALDKNGNFEMVYNTNAMIRGFADHMGQLKIGILKEFFA